MEEIIKAITDGRAEGESKADVVTLCFLASLYISASRRPEMVSEDEENGMFASLLEQMGKILCPLADDVKNNNRDYREEMTRVRMQYRGITFSERLQDDWRNRIAVAESEGFLSSVEVAVESRVYFRLARELGLQGGFE